MIFNKEGFTINFPWRKKEKKPNLIKDIINNPEKFITIISIENEELNIKVVKK